MSVTVPLRRSGPACSAVNEITAGNAPPRPMPARKRNPASWAKLFAAEQANVIDAASISAPTSSGLRPSRSDNGPIETAPRIAPK